MTDSSREPTWVGQLEKELSSSTAKILKPGTEGYDESLKRFNGAIEKRAPAVVMVKSDEDIATTVKFAVSNEVLLVVKGGGHTISGGSSTDEGIVVDLSQMRGVQINKETREIVAQGGCLWEDVDVAAAAEGLVTVGGTVNHTGIGGLTLGGGYGYLSGLYGLTIDNLLRVKIVLADGSCLVASETENPDLFWAVRGAGRGFGVVTEFVFRAHPAPASVWAGMLGFTMDKLHALIAAFNEVAGREDPRACLSFGFATPPGSNVVMPLALPVYFGTEEESKAFFAPFFALEPTMNSTAVLPSYTAVNSLLNPMAKHGGRKNGGGSNFTLPLNADKVSDIFQDFNRFVLANQGSIEAVFIFEAWPNNKIREVSNEAMAFSNRGAYHNVATSMKWEDPALDDEFREFNRNFLKKIGREMGIDGAASGQKGEGSGIYANSATAEYTPQEIYGRNSTKLKVLKKKYDPGNIFSPAKMVSLTHM
ncbi:FAD binding oxidoreductase [Eremomyces bilateralis CBS 781.70]|uniref:FAD binding oxidoreductase n=1 Tax=Eremomyces bilateralis CBS 781.70 TaxID=1392243 RepID=A0A6G1G9D0_9PEZI|nr:FAD binding oxidoreductase [Eremomyces bilateralis CBS 781.70]KAF1814623.1 FAD binding oxidoreductase [Eremomyces bilateralis CBS 781.70]